MIRLLATVATFAALLQLTGCASIVSGTNQPVSVETITASGDNLAGASCKLSNNKGTWFVTTPGSTTVNRSFEDLAIHCTKDTHEPGLVTAKSSTKGMAFGNILFGGVIGAGVDMASGAAYDYPVLIKVRMGTTQMLGQPAQAAAPPQQPAATTAVQR